MSALLIDTYSLFFRAFYGLPPMNTRTGEPTSALYGFCTVVLKLLREQRGAELAFAVDAPAQTFRRAEYDGYKAQRAELPSDLRRQFARLEELLSLLAVPVHRVPGFEADDVLATLARRRREQGAGACVVSGDRDLLQVARGTTQVLFVGRRGKAPIRYDEAAVVERFGVPPERLPSYVALVGDASDNLPGVPGIGPTTAQKLLAAHQNAESLLSDLDRVENPKLRAALAAHREQILKVERLATLCDGVPLSGAPVAVPDADAWRALRVWFLDLEFRSLVPRLDALLDGAG